jgi:hypothetical protein
MKRRTIPPVIHSAYRFVFFNKFKNLDYVKSGMPEKGGNEWTGGSRTYLLK